MSDSTTAARTLLAGLRDAGVGLIVLCPGSRSAPFAYAAAALETAGHIRLHVETDERVAGFVALGWGKSQGRPAAVITTSGTAVANLHPAVLESHHSGVPLLVISADRPASMRETGANQTTMQPGIFGSAPVAEYDVVPDDISTDFASELVNRACGHGGIPGPVHVNIQLAEPLVPAELTVWLGNPAVAPTPAPELPERIELSAEPRTVIVAGPVSPRAAALGRLPEGPVGIPVLAEPGSPLRPWSIPGYRLLTDTFGEQIERVICSGHPTLSRPIAALLARRDIEKIVIAEDPVPTDVSRSASRVIPAWPTFIGEHSQQWLDQWTRAGAAVADAMAEALGSNLDALTAARALAEAPGPLVLGASNIIRDVDLVGPSDREGWIHANRGLAGIDGTISTAIGLAVAEGCPVRVGVGDLTFLHDMGALAQTVGQQVPPIDVVVIDDSGGGIFATLEHGEDQFAGVFDRVFRTAKDVDIATVARGCGWDVEVPETLAELRTVLGSTPRSHRVVWVRVPPREVAEIRGHRARINEVLGNASRGVQ